jgi:hypothetical protein
MQTARGRRRSGPAKRRAEAEPESSELQAAARKENDRVSLPLVRVLRAARRSSFAPAPQAGKSVAREPDEADTAAPGAL